MNIANITPQTAPSLESLLDAMSRYGKPGVSMENRGWHCRCEMHVASEGTSFTVRSEFDHKTPLIAAQLCMERIVSTTKKFKELA